MNNNLNGMAEHDLLCFRLQTVRRKKRMQHEDFEKKLIALNKEREQLYRQKRELGWVELKPPVMKGWKRFFVLRDDIARSKHASFFESILQKVNTVEYSSRKDFKVKKRKGGKKIYVLRDQQLLQPDENHFKKLNFSEREAQFFEVRYVREKWMKQPKNIYVFAEPWRYAMRIRPNLITKVRARDEAIERRIHEINAFIDSNGFNGKLLNLLHGNDRWSWHENEKPSERNWLKNKSIPAISDVLAEEANM